LNWKIVIALTAIEEKFILIFKPETTKIQMVNKLKVFLILITKEKEFLVNLREESHSVP